VAGVAGLSAGIGYFRNKWLDTQKTLDYSILIEQVNKQKSTLVSLRDEYETLMEKTNKTKSEQERMIQIQNQLASSSIELGDSIRDSSGAFAEQAEIVEATNETIDKYEKLSRVFKRKQAADQLFDLSGIQDAMKALDDYMLMIEKYEEYKDLMGKGELWKDDTFEQYLEREMFKAEINPNLTLDESIKEAKVFAGVLDQLRQKYTE
jgi:hypothetical protein